MHIFNENFCTICVNVCIDVSASVSLSLHLCTYVWACMLAYLFETEVSENVRKPNAHWRMHRANIFNSHKVNSFSVVWNGNCAILLKNPNREMKRERRRVWEYVSEKEMKNKQTHTLTQRENLLQWYLCANKICIRKLQWLNYKIYTICKWSDERSNRRQPHTHTHTNVEIGSKTKNRKSNMVIE